ncbi:MAG TPA: ribosome silencing factor [Leptospiraceae bacterium]|jgi:ribosome-associated protein|nr:ribosome silencing factor [Leptospirales bacterium]HMU82420.1 ribosome silencing factor [Leptospiraceae bacterium]HMW58247.1 ribosome silencing factor [Leptospiraceae bacterium]HMY44983.1 ribosome silencing factor [Leptospiraceae bacterium]HMZ37332.1 ribosome silencing factor [Leptospiraceae bacterium]
MAKKAVKASAPRKSPTKPGPSEKLVKEVTELLQEKKASRIVWMNLTAVNPYFDFFLLASAGSRVQLKSLVKDIEKKFPSLERRNSSISADDMDSGWLVLDFGDVVVHLFLEEQRRYYNLERLWGDAVITEIQDESTRESRLLSEQSAES